MSKPGHGRGKSSRREKKTQVWQLVFAIAVIAALASTWILLTGERSTPSAESESADAPITPVVVPGMEDRMVLPATPRTPRPVTLNPAAFNEPETKAAYQAAKDTPDALEHVACYCGCFANSGHRNNLDCFRDSHGAT
jgi:Protein of unknown function with PCYCGC motif